MVNLKKEPIELPTKEIPVEPRQLLDVLQIIHVMKKVNVENPDEFLLLDDIHYKLMDSLQNDKDFCSITMNSKDLFSVWLCIDSYQSFCQDVVDDEEEREYVVKLMKTFSWPADKK